MGLWPSWVYRIWGVGIVLCVAVSVILAGCAVTIPYVEPPPVSSGAHRPSVTMEYSPAEVARNCWLSGVRPANSIACTIPKAGGLCVIIMPKLEHPEDAERWNNLLRHEQVGHCDLGLAHNARGYGWRVPDTNNRPCVPVRTIGHVQTVTTAEPVVP